MLSRLYVIINQLHFRHLPHPLSCYNPKSPGTPRLLLAPKFFTTSKRAKLCPASRGVPHPRACQPWPAGPPPQPARAPGRLRSLGHSAVLTPSAPEETQMRALSSDKLTTKRKSTNGTFLQESSFFLRGHTRRKAPGRTGALGPSVCGAGLTESPLAVQMSLPLNTRAFPGLDSN